MLYHGGIIRPMIRTGLRVFVLLIKTFRFISSSSLKQNPLRIHGVFAKYPVTMVYVIREPWLSLAPFDSQEAPFKRRRKPEAKENTA